MVMVMGPLGLDEALGATAGVESVLGVISNEL
jgi:hypothetical protein